MTMSNEMLAAMQDVDPIRHSLDEAVRQARNDLTLSDVGRQMKIAAAWLDATQKIADLKAAAFAAEDARRKKLQEQVFGLDTSGVPLDVQVAQQAAFRDALDRADKAVAADNGPATLLRLVERSLRVADDLQAKAAVSVALEKGFGDTVDRYLLENPALEAPIQELQSLNPGPAGDRVADRLRSEMNFSLAKPTEISALQPYQLQALLNGNEDGTPAATVAWRPTR
jgi:hypothetical protein